MGFQRVVLMAAIRAAPHRPPPFAGDRKVSAWTSAKHDVEIRNRLLISFGDIPEIERRIHAVDCAVAGGSVLVNLAE